MFTFTQKLPTKVRSVVNKVLQRIVFCDNPDNTLIVMIHNTEHCAKRLILRKIFKSEMAPLYGALQQILKVTKMKFNLFSVSYST